MADRIPVKAIYTGADATALGELATGDTISASYINGLAGEVTGTGDATVVADNIIDEANLKVSNSPTNGYVLTAQSGNTGGLTWASASGYTHPNHSGEVTSSADGAQTIADNVVDEANLKVSNAPTNGYVLTAQSGNTGGLTWSAVNRAIGVIVVAKGTAIADGTDILGAIEIPLDCTITELRAKTATGTATVTFKNAGSTVGAVNATTSGVSNTSLSNASMSVWDDLTIDVSSASGNGLYISLKVQEA